MNIEEVLKYAVDSEISDVFIVAGFPLAYKNNSLRYEAGKITQEESKH